MLSFTRRAQKASSIRRCNLFTQTSTCQRDRTPRQLKDKVRYAVILLAWQRIIETTKQLRQASPSSLRPNAKSRPRLTEADLEYFYAAFFIDSNGIREPADAVPEKEEVLAWFNGMRPTASAYSFLGYELGLGALFHVVPHFTESQVVHGLVRNTNVCTAGLAYVRSIGLVDNDMVLELGGRVEGLVSWIERKITGGE